MLGWNLIKFEAEMNNTTPFKKVLISFVTPITHRLLDAMAD